MILDVISGIQMYLYESWCETFVKLLKERTNDTEQTNFGESVNSNGEGVLLLG